MKLLIVQVRNGYFRCIMGWTDPDLEFGGVQKQVVKLLFKRIPTGASQINSEQQECE